MDKESTVKQGTGHAQLAEYINQDGFLPALGKASKSSCSNFPGLLIDWSQTAHPSPLIPPTEGTVASFRLKKQITPAPNQSLLRKKPLHQAQRQPGEDKAPSLAIERQLLASSNAGRQHLGFGLSWSERQHLLKPPLPSGHRQVPLPHPGVPSPLPVLTTTTTRQGETQGAAATSPLTAKCSQHPCLRGFPHSNPFGWKPNPAVPRSQETIAMRWVAGPRARGTGEQRLGR